MCHHAFQVCSLPPGDAACPAHLAYRQCPAPLYKSDLHFFILSHKQFHGMALQASINCLIMASLLQDKCPLWLSALGLLQGAVWPWSVCCLCGTRPGQHSTCGTLSLIYMQYVHMPPTPCKTKVKWREASFCPVINTFLVNPQWAHSTM